MSFVESMSANIGNSGLGFTYSCLETFFLHMVHLHVLSLRIYLGTCSIAMLWSPSNARHLREQCLAFTTLLAECPFIYTADDFLAITDCCSHVPGLTLRDSFMRNINSRRGLKDESWQTRQARVAKMAPATPQMVIDRALGPRQSFLGRLSTTVMRSRTSVPVFRNTSHIQRLTLDTPGMEEDEFMRLISRCPGFKELTFVGNAAARSSSPGRSVRLPGSSLPTVVHDCSA